jgi:hypothetical protein
VLRAPKCMPVHPQFVGNTLSSSHPAHLRRPPVPMHASSQMAYACTSVSMLGFVSQVSTLQSALERSQAGEAALTSRVLELNNQLANSSAEGGSLRTANGELLAELTALRCGSTPSGGVLAVWGC